MSTARALPPERLGVAGGVALSAGTAWAALWLAQDAAPGTGLAALCLTAGGPVPGFGALWAMWTLMGAAMMLPTALPALDLYARLARRAPRAPLTTAAFAAGYLAVWAAAALPFAAAHGALGPAGAGVAPNALAGGLLLAAGLYQLTPLKRACLTRCRAPLPVFLQHWRDGAGGALGLGLRHGADCLGCCWALMGLMLMAGAMNLVWMAALGLAMAAEKALPGGAAFGRRAGQAMALAGAALLAASAN